MTATECDGSRSRAYVDVGRREPMIRAARAGESTRCQACTYGYTVPQDCRVPSHGIAAAPTQ